MKTHPASELFALLSGPEFEELVEDIREHGLREPIVTHRGEILDGRNRLRACEVADVEPRFREWEGNDSAIAFVVSANIVRRHLTSGQKAMIADKLRPLFAEEARAARVASGQDFGRGKVPPDSEERIATGANETAKRAGDLVGVGVNRVYEAAAIRRDDPELAEAVEQGDVSLGAAFEQRKRKPKTGPKQDMRNSKWLGDALAPLRRYVSGWSEERVAGIAPRDARRLLKQVQEINSGLFEVERALEQRSVVSRALR